MALGRQYSKVSLKCNGKHIYGLLAFIDCGSDLTVIRTSLAKKLGIKGAGVRIRWTASDGDERESSLGSVSLKRDVDPVFITLEDVLIDDAPFDSECGEHLILGLDYLQKTKAVLTFDD